MSVIMQQGLASLLIRRTDEARAKAQQRMEAWQAAIAAVQQAEKIAECKINLLAEQIEIAQRAAVKVRTANYILAVHLDKKATTERNAVIAIATEALQAEIKHRQWQETMAKQELQSAISERANTITAAERERLLPITAAERERDNAIAVAEREMEAEISRIQLETLEKTHNNLGSVNTLLVLLSGIIAVTLAKGVGIFAYIHDTAIDLILGALIFLGGIIIGGTVVIKIYKFMVRNEESSRIGAVKATYEKAVEAATKRSEKAIEAAIKRSEKAIEAAIKRVEIVSPALEESIRLLEAHREKAEKALGWLKAQA